MSRTWPILIVALAACGTPPERDSKYLFDYALANDYYKAGKYEEAMRKYEDAIERHPKSYNAIVGLACADREYGLKKFEEAEDLHRAKKVDLAKKEFEKAVKVHSAAQMLLRKAIEMKPEEPLAYRELGVFYYKRATSPYSYPYRLDDVVNRQKERDLAIDNLRIVVKREPNLFFAQRYLGFALLARALPSEWSEARICLEFYLRGMNEGREHLRLNAPKSTPEQREEVEKRLKKIDRELEEVCEVLLAHLRSLEEQRARALRCWEAIKNENPEMEPAAKKVVDGLTVEILAVEGLLRRYREVEQKKPEDKQSQ